MGQEKNSRRCWKIQLKVSEMEM
uniref:Uncharacterized protein n=1 Tax=Rhizophora mucronata TaxID=61149 RepID=A0A2P2PRJ3_RHIMU